jgi:ADP-ribosylglycohydrolase
MGNPEQVAVLLYDELAQRREEGYDVAALQREWDSLGMPPLRVHRPVPPEHVDTVQRHAERLEALYRALEALDRPRAGFHYDEPSTLDEIRAARPDGPRRLPLRLSEAALQDRLLGAWLGRAAGCLLGKPVENWSRAAIRRVLEHAGEYPLRQYLPSFHASAPAGAGAAQAADGGGVQADVSRLTSRPQNWYRGHIDRMVRDDDMDYPLIGLHLLERVGPAFTTADVGRVWQSTLPYMLVYTAERVAYRNLVDGLQPPETATYRNPYREWIGAQIRADMWGWVSPGRPEQAAALAYRDAALSHVKNGIYGEMFFAAAIAAAFAVDTLAEALQIGLTEVPPKTRFAEAVRQTMDWVREDGDFQKTTDRIHEAYGQYHSVHTINNAALVVMGLLYAEQAAQRGEELLEPAICLTVMGGWDTDCTGATAGSLVGALRGAEALPPKWVGDFHDRLESIVIGMTDNRFTDLAARTLAQAQRLEG